MEETLGQKLKQIREAQNISLEEISQKTHIRLTFLRAIETDDIESLPSRTHMRGFLRLYASQLGAKIEDLESEVISPSEVQTDAHPDLEQEETTTPVPDSAEEESLGSQPEPKTESEYSLPESQNTEELVDFEQAENVEDEVPQERSDIFINIGNLLKTRRELLSLSINDIHNNIFIPNQYIKALEEGRFNQLSSPVQTKGMIANYAEFLNLDVDEILLKYADGLQRQRLEKQNQKPSKEKNTANEMSKTKLRLKNFFSLDLLVITAFFIIFAGFIMWGVNRIMVADTGDTAATELPGVSDVLLATGSPTPQLTPLPDDLSQLEVTGNGVQSEDNIESEETPIFTPSVNNNAINIVILPRQRTWVQITSDSENIFEGRLIPGNAYEYSGQETVEILTGNAGALQIFFNDQDIGTPGLIGQVVNLVFTETGLILPTPTNTPIFTNTPEKTPTLTITP